MEKKTIAILFAVSLTFLAFLVWSFRQKATAPTEIPNGQSSITNFEECLAAGFPVGESYPRQCFADGQGFTEEIEDGASSLPMTETEALAIAREKCPVAVESWGAGSYNENSATWWFDVRLAEPKAGCNPACVVAEPAGEVEVNWRCTGLISEEAPAGGASEPSPGA